LRTALSQATLAIITARRRLLNLARDLQQGIEPFPASHGDVYRVRAMDVNTAVDDFDAVIANHGSGLLAKVYSCRRVANQTGRGKGIGHFFGAMQIDGFIDKDEFVKQIDDWIQVFRDTKPAPGTNGPLIPGDPEREAQAIRNKEGIPLLKPVVDELLDISKKASVPFDLK
jgi:hypothetical protein